MKRKIIAIIVAVALLTAGLTVIPIMAAPATGSIANVQLTPDTVTLVTGTTQQFTAQALDDTKQPVSNVTYFWLVAPEAGTIDTTGLFKAGSVGTYDDAVKVIAAQGTTVKIATAKVKVVASMGPLDHIKIMPTTANIAPSGTQQFSAQGYDSNNVAIPNLTYVWSVVGMANMVSSNGLFNAGATTGTYTVQANVQNTTVPPGTATVTVTTNPSPTTTPIVNNNKSSLFGFLKRYLKSIGSDNFLGGQWQIKNSSGGTDTYKLISGVVQNLSETKLTVMVNGQTTATIFTLPTNAVIQPKNAVLAANDKVIVLTVNDQVTMVSKITAVTTTQEPPGLKKQDNDDNQQGKDTPPGWSQGKKTGWNKDSSNGDTGSHSDGH